MSFSNSIALWYQQNKRDLPWRNAVSPYRTWLSEVILQQTRVNQGLPYYLKFVEHFPTVSDLALADEDTVLKLWQGLGYYSRARNMHRTAQLIHEKHNGIFPNNYADLIQLKGIGPYTAAAIASICTDEKVAVVDGNVYRVLSRYFSIDLPIDSTQGKHYFSQLANELLDETPSSIHNQAIMELGALICTPKNTQCQVCPLESSCEGKKNKTFENLPIKSKKVKVRNRFFYYFLVIDAHGQVVMKKRGPKDIWEGLYEFVLLEMDKEEINEQQINDFIKQFNTTIESIQLIQTSSLFQHKLSHQLLHARFYIVKVDQLPKEFESNYVYLPLQEVPNFPVPQLIQNYLNNEFENLLSLL